MVREANIARVSQEPQLTQPAIAHRQSKQIIIYCLKDFGFEELKRELE